LAGVRKAARERKETKFTALLHHLTVDLLRESFYALKRKAAPGVDGTTWQEYETGLEGRLVDLHGRVHRGAYRAKPSRRVYIPKADGRQRPLGVAALEDKVVQQAVVTILNQIYEEDFLGFSYGFRPRRSQHQALDALSFALMRKKVNYVLDADIRGFFDEISHEWMLKFVQHRVADPRILRLIQKWLEAGVMEEGKWSETEMGTPQGAVISPLLANIYLHYVFDLWVNVWRMSTLKPSERFFSIDEFGPFAVKKHGGRRLVGPGEYPTTPQFQKSKGRLIITAALELSTNQVTHFYSSGKNTGEMIKLLELLLTQYRDCTRLYLSWDAAGWHASKRFSEKVDEVNSRMYRRAHRTPLVELAPLPARAQFLNVIESLFSGLAVSVIHNSDYPSVDDAKAAIDRYFAERNAYFKEHPKRAGNKIWGRERVPGTFQEGQNCKNPRFR
jgi:retron-type reverse transcriptase